MTPRRAAIGALVLAVLGVALWQAAIHWRPSTDRYPRQGIDVSHRNGVVDWVAVAESGEVDFAYIEASEGADRRDRRFAENWAGAGSAEIGRGAYHVFTLCAPGDRQAANFIAAVPKTPAMLPPAVDLAFNGNCSARPLPDTLITELMVYLQRVEAHYGQPVTLYLTREFDAAYDVSARIDRRLWLRRLGFEPHWGARPWSIWQASGFRQVPGIRGGVDWNVARS